jgi:hypothetical protein
LVIGEESKKIFKDKKEFLGELLIRSIGLLLIDNSGGIFEEIVKILESFGLSLIVGIFIFKLDFLVDE